MLCRCEVLHVPHIRILQRAYDFSLAKQLSVRGISRFLRPDTKLNGSEPYGYIASHRWMKQRILNGNVEKIIFGDFTNVHDTIEMKPSRLTGHASVSGLPITEDFTYETRNNISEADNLDGKLRDNLKIMGLCELTPIQIHAIGLLSIDNCSLIESVESNDLSPKEKQLSYQRVTGKYDLMAAAQTGSGKTLAYLVPILNRLMRVYPYEAMQALLKFHACQFPSCLVLAPTRELVQQITSEASKLCFRTFVRPVSLFGGESSNKQLNELNKGCHVVIATPGRLLDFLQRELLSLKYCRTLVFDEADRMLDMGFEEQIREILETPKFKMPKAQAYERQTALFSATFPRKVSLLARDFLRGSNCISLTLTYNEQHSRAVVPDWGRASYNQADEFEELSRVIPKEIDQVLELVTGRSQSSVTNRLLEVINQITEHCGTESTDFPKQLCRILVFCNTKREADHIDTYLYNNKVNSAPIHGDKSQSDRNRALQLFRKGTVNVLVATSIAARGLDIPNIHAVININLPNQLDDYVHRIGRTGRMGRVGKAITLISEDTLYSSPTAKSVLCAILQLLDSGNNLNRVPSELIRLSGYSNAGKTKFKSPSVHSSGHHSHTYKGRTNRFVSELNRRYS